MVVKHQTEQGLLKKLMGQYGVQDRLSQINTKMAEQYAMKLGNMLSDASTVALSKHGDFGLIDAEVTLGEKSIGSVTYYIILNDAHAIRPSISYKDHDPVNMLDEFNYGWHARTSFRATDRHGNRITTRDVYRGEEFIEDTIRDFNASAPDGVYAYNTMRFGDGIEDKYDIMNRGKFNRNDEISDNFSRRRFRDY